MFASTEIHWHLFIITMAIINLTPGVAMLFAISESIQNGVKYGIIATIGLELGTFTYLILSVLGLTLVFQTAHWVFEGIQLLGAVYLIYLGIKLMMSIKQTAIQLEKIEVSTSKVKIFSKGYLLNLLNPKLGLFFLVFLPQFVPKSGSHIPEQLFALGVIFNLGGLLVNLIAACIFNQHLVTKLAKSKLQNFAWLSKAIPGIIFMCLGIFTLYQFIIFT